MFGKVQEDSFQSIFDLSLDDNSYDSKSLSSQQQQQRLLQQQQQLGLGLGRNTADSLSTNLVASLISLQQKNQQQTGSPPTHNNSTWGNSLFQLPVSEEKPGFSFELSLQKLDLVSSSGSPSISSPTSSTHSFDIPREPQPQLAVQPGAPGSRQSKAPPPGFDFGCLDSDSASSTSSSTCSSSSSKTINSSRYKTELCRPYQENGTCKYGDKCQFAHGMKELRTITRHPKYKTDLCRTYHSSGFCPYGPRCHFIHNLEEQQSSQSVKNKAQAANAGSQQIRDEKETVVQLPIFQSRRTLDGLYQDHSPQDLSLGQVAAMGEAASGKQQFCSEAVAQQQQHPRQTSVPEGSRLPVFSTLFH